MTSRRPYVMGFDPGVHGAFAVIERATKNIVAIHDMPVSQRVYNRKGRKPTTRHLIDVPALALLVEQYAPDTEVAVVEDVGTMPTDGVVGAFKFGETKGILLGILAANMVPVHLVTPSVWKMAAGLTSSKCASLDRARKLWPASLKYFERKKDSDRAEAALLARSALVFAP